VRRYFHVPVSNGVYRWLLSNSHLRWFLLRI
jgi:hypothetical protein